MSALPLIHALVPVKDFGLAKERLAPLLAPPERADLARAMFLDVMDALRRAPAIRRIWVVSAARDVLDAAAALGAFAVSEPSQISGLNPALEHGRSIALDAADPPDGLLIVPADLPSLTAAALDVLLKDLPKPGEGRLVRICPAPDGGTNALLQIPGDAVRLCYGRDSARRHADAAQDAGVDCEFLRIPELTTDLDTPADVQRWLAGSVSGRTAELLRRLGFSRQAGRVAEPGYRPTPGNET
ncbi:MAG: 2-phospho-L-lactate guanylyltransferase [Dehalococcoidia bacterium]